MSDNITPHLKTLFVGLIANDKFDEFESMVNLHPQLLTIPLNPDEQTALLVAAQNGRTEFVEYIIKNSNAQINYQDKNGRTALHYAIRKNYANLIKLLLEHDADLSVKDNDRKEAYFCMNSIATIHTFLSLGYSVDHEVNGKTALFQFSSDSRLNDLSEYLLEIGANPDFLSGSQTPLFNAITYNPELGRHLIVNYGDKIDFNRTSPISKMTYLHVAAKSGMGNINLEIIKLINEKYIKDIDIKAEGGFTPLMLAVKYGRYDNMNTLIDLGANPHAVTINGETVLHYAAMSYGHNSDCIIDLITSYGLDIDANAYNKKQGRAGTPLTYAIGIGNSVEKINFLIENFGAKISRYDLGVSLMSNVDIRITKAVITSAGKDLLNSKDENGQTPIFGAINFRPEILGYMIKCGGADPTVRDNNGNDILSYLIARRAEEHVLMLLDRAGKRLIRAETDDQCSYLNLAIRSNLPRTVKELVELYNNEDKKNKKDKILYKINKVSTTVSPYLPQMYPLEACPLELAIRLNNTAITNLLLRAGAKQDITISNCTLIDFVCRGIRSLPMLKFLVENFNFNLNQSNNNGLTPAFAIPILGLPEEIDGSSIVGYLLLKGIDIEINDNKGHTPILEYITRNADPESVRLFCKHFEYLLSKIKSSLLRSAIIAAMVRMNYDEKFIINRINAHQKDIDVVNFRCKKGQSMLHIAINEGKNEVAKFLLNKGIEFNDSNDTKRNEVMSAFALAVCLDRFELVEIMLEKDPLSIKDKIDGVMILEYVLRSGDFKMFKLLVEKSNPELSEIYGEFGKQLASIASKYVGRFSGQKNHEHIAINNFLESIRAQAIRRNPIN